MNLGEHRMTTGIRPFTELGLLPTDKATSGTEDRTFATAELSICGWTSSVKRTKENANRAVHLTTMPSALSARRLLGRLWCRKQVVVGDLGR